MQIQIPNGFTQDRNNPERNDNPSETKQAECDGRWVRVGRCIRDNTKTDKSSRRGESKTCYDHTNVDMPFGKAITGRRTVLCACCGDYGGTAPKYCMFHKRGWLPLPPVEHTKLGSCTSVGLYISIAIILGHLCKERTFRSGDITCNGALGPVREPSNFSRQLTF